ncbi:pilus (MSHA type) biogenesis protein MshL [Helicobacter pametensis]|uniref:pilus (MSHA type) biogenesis protein MshL n=1 Tax=Helicobacter pametensis TaxID=95149 RepID=UPI0004BCD8D1|nr:pilus (MSHA type) biogenesis protein MshL [Helicobacter pametensis]
MKSFLIILFCFCIQTYSMQCQRFTLKTQEKLTSLEILEEIAQSCKLNIIYTDSFAHTILSNNKPKLHIDNLDFQTLIDLLLDESHLHYTLQNNILKIAFLYTKTYELNYVSTSRMGSSSTDVILSPNPSSYEIYPSSPMFQTSNSAPILSDNASMGNTGRSGTKILSVDENNFWGEIHKELTEIAYRPEDRFVDQFPKSITINKNAGLLTITANKIQHQRIQSYLAQLNAKMHAQVLIDVHILLIKHEKSNTSGINWNEFYNLGNLAIPAPSLQGGSSFIQIGNNGINMELNILSQGTTLNRIIEFLQTYGTTRSLSNPKVLTLNNQPAIISVGSVLRYIQNSVYQSSSQGSNIQNSTENYPSIFAGVLLDVTPSIQGDEIILKINPSITRAKNAALENEPNALKTPPNLSTNQLSSLVKVKSGEKIVLGGLISDLESKKEFKIPLLGDIPILEYLFKYKWSNHFSEEMVIIISPKIIQTPQKQSSNPSTFSQDFKSLLKEARLQALEEKLNESKTSK